MGLLNCPRQGQRIPKIQAMPERQTTIVLEVAGMYLLSSPSRQSVFRVQTVPLPEIISLTPKEKKVRGYSLKDYEDHRSKRGAVLKDGCKAYFKAYPAALDELDFGNFSP